MGCPQQASFTDTVYAETEAAEEVLSWNDDFSAAYSGPDSTQYPTEQYDTTSEEFDNDVSGFFDETPKTKVGVFGFHLGPNSLCPQRPKHGIRNGQHKCRSFMGNPIFLRSETTSEGLNLVQFETGLGIGASVLSFKNGLTIDKDPMMFGAANLVPISD